MPATCFDSKTSLSGMGCGGDREGVVLMCGVSGGWTTAQLSHDDLGPYKLGTGQSTDETAGKLACISIVEGLTDCTSHVHGKRYVCVASGSVATVCDTFPAVSDTTPKVHNDTPGP